MWRPAVGLLNQLAIHFVLQFWVGQAHLQSILGQRGVVIDGWRLNQHVDEELTGLQEEGKIFLSILNLILNSTALPAGGGKHTPYTADFLEAAYFKCILKEQTN